MKQIGGIWLPDNEQHMVKWMQTANLVVDGKLTYQYNKLQAALKYVKRWNTALDIGAHVGLWSMHLAKRFKRVCAFEPVPEHRDCFLRNVTQSWVKLYPVALGKALGEAGFGYESNSTGGTHLVEGGNATIVVPLDDYNLGDVDFVKIDVEGYELQVLLGGADTIRKSKPTIIVEQKPKHLAERYGHQRYAARDLLVSWGAQVQSEISGDVILAWP